MAGYRPMTLADLAGRLARTADSRVRWKLVWEFLEECRWEPADVQLELLQDEPPPTGDERWDTLLAALAEHLAAGHDAAPPQWAELRVLAGHGFPLSCRSSGQRRWCGHRPPSASTGCTSQAGTWRPRERPG